MVGHAAPSLVAARLAGGSGFKIADAGKPDCYGKVACFRF